MPEWVNSPRDMNHGRWVVWGSVAPFDSVCTDIFTLTSLQQDLGFFLSDFPVCRLSSIRGEISNSPPILCRISNECAKYGEILPMLLSFSTKHLCMIVHSEISHNKCPFSACFDFFVVHHWFGILIRLLLARPLCSSCWQVIQKW